MCVLEYPAHRFCKHPNRVTPRDENWTRDLEIVFCENATLVRKHARSRREMEDATCDRPPYRARLVYDGWCLKCELGDGSGSATSLREMFTRNRDEWSRYGDLDEEELQLVEQDIDIARDQQRAVANMGPYNNSYFELKNTLQTFIENWEEYIRVKKAAAAAEAEEAEAWRLARLETNLGDAAETSLYSPGWLSRAQAQAEAEAEASLAREEDERRRDERYHERRSRLSRFFGRR